MSVTVTGALVGWFTKYAFAIVEKVLDNYKALTPEQLDALKSKFNKIAEAKDNEPSD